MIGPIFRSPHRAPRSEPVSPTLVRRTKNAMTDLIEYALKPFARWEKERLVTERVEIGIRGLGSAFDGYRIAFLTDLHVSPLVPVWWLERAIQAALDLKTDLISLGGDFLDDDASYIPMLAGIVRPLHAPDGVVGVLGNHDHYVGAHGVRTQLVQGGVRELYNESVTIVRGAERLVIGGIGDLQSDAIDFHGVFAGVLPETPRLVLSHDPDVFAYWPSEVRLDLMLSGHTHGGQAFLPIIGPPYVPSQFGFRYLAGRFHDQDRQLYVSRGVGSSGVPFRWGCPPELTEVVLRPSPS
ncbi:MAG TPA: metallophosphoesterase [Gemmatimonadales bacterium]